MVSGITAATSSGQQSGSSAEWSYAWYRDGNEHPVHKTYSSSRHGDRYTINSAAESHSGQYTCKGESTAKPFYSRTSDLLTLKVSNKPKAVLTLEPPGGEIFTGDRVTLRCGVGGDPASWKYLWFKDTQGTALPQTDSSSVEGSSYTISSATLYHSGEYQCIAQRRNGLLYSEYSDSVMLKIATRPKAVLTLETGGTVVFVTESVTLRCEVQGSSAWWSYAWYRDGNEHPVHKTYSSNKPKAVLTLEPPGGEIFTGDRVTLRCGVGGDPASWKYLWYKDTQGTALPQTDSSSVEGSSYTISSAALYHSGEYWCRAGRGNGLFYSEYSDSVRFNVSVLKWQLSVVDCLPLPSPPLPQF
ncbi:Fc receptor-like protein 1 [Polyodon spathula]|uniref:Fc receptor-like protein 1 n=1 Tax=Polyodon spathula TaxID=7913 RepID=UPI001B7E452E|nr:Fc receptor-like protein 1 [Polyodon spathula]